MKKKLKSAKRLLAFMCVFSLLAGMLPVPDIQNTRASAADGDLLYIFNDNDYLSSDYIVGKDSNSGVADASYAYIAELPGTVNSYSVTNLSAFAKTLTYDKTKAKGAPWELSSAFVTQMLYNAANADKFAASPTWVRFYNGSRGITFYVYGNANRKAHIGIKLKVEEGQEGWYNAVPSYFFNTRRTTDAGITFTLYDGASESSDVKLAGSKLTGVSARWQEPSLGTTYFEAGEYLLLIQVDTLNSTSTASGANVASVRNITLKPVEEPEDYSVRLKAESASIAARTIEAGEQGEATVELVNAGKKIEGAVFTAEAITPDIASVSLTGDKVTVTGRKPGKAKLAITASVGGEDIAALELEMTVTPMKCMYSFLNSAAKDTDIKEITSFDMTADTSPDPWCFAFQNDKTTAFRLTSPTGYGTVLSQQIGTAAGIKILVPEDGIYSPELLYMGGTIHGAMRMYIAPADADNPIAEEYSVGHKDTYMAVGKYDTAYFRTVYLEKGEHIISWEIIGKNPDITNVPRLFLTAVTLVNHGEYPAVEVSLDNAPDSIKLGNNAQIKLSATASDGSIEDLVGAEFIMENAQERIAKIEPVVNEDGSTSLKVTGIKTGQESIPVDVYTRGVKRASFVLPVNILEPLPLDAVKVSFRESKYNTVALRELADVQGHLDVELTDTSGEIITEYSAELQNAVYSYTSSNEAVAKIDGDGVITPISAGTANIRCDVTIDGITRGDELELIVTNGKTRRSYYTDKKVAAAQENVKKYSWASSTAKATASAADKYVDKTEELYNMITSQELPRSYLVGFFGDPAADYCRYPDCGKNLLTEYGSKYPWLLDAFNSPWKVQCPACRRKFPSNDFGSFYQLGIVEAGESEQYGVPSSQWSYEKAHYEHYKMFADDYAVAGVESYEEHKAMRDAGERLPAVGYLKNTMYPNMDDTWGVDDGYGYDTGIVYENGLKKVDTYIAYYNHWAIWHSSGVLYTAVKALRDAYIYTDDIKYGRAGAIILDRIADIYPELSLRPYVRFMSSTAKTVGGTGTDRIWGNAISRDWAKAYDAFFPAYEDEQVVSFLSQKAAQYGAENPKTNASLIRENCENGILREIFEDAQNGDLVGNFGMTQSAVAMAAVALDSIPESIEMLDWVYQNGEMYAFDPNSYTPDAVTGGDVMRKVINEISRDGTNIEIGPNYIRLWYGNINIMLDILAGYDKYPQADLYNNPRYVKMMWSLLPFTMSRASSVQIGDSGAVADQTLYLDSTATEAFRQTGKPVFAQILYFLNGNTSKGLHYDMYTDNPERLASEVQSVIDTYGEYDFDQSNLLAGYGLAALRGGTLVESIGGDIDTQRTFWMSFTRGQVSGHHHYDGLNLGVEAYGLNIAPELGYPYSTAGDIYHNWGKATVAHNTVVVDRKHQVNTETSEPMHFDDAGFVKVMDVDASDRYAVTDKYRRTVVTVDVNEELSYGVDFFRVKGGNEHVYSFHALSSLTPEAAKLDGSEISFTAQKDEATGEYKGSYAGAEIPYKTEGNTSGFTWLYNVDRAANPGNELYVDFKIQDFRKTLEKDRNLHLKLTMLNDFELSELAFANGSPSGDNNNPEYLKFMLAKREGKELDSLFTAVIEPYDGESNIEKLEQVTVTDKDGNAVDTSAVKAVKVTLKSGRADYIIYAEDNSIEYLVDGRIAFQGFVGVYSEKDGENVYSYMNDGVKLGAMTGTACLSGTVEGFTKELTDKNFITVKFDRDVVPEELAGEHIYVAECARGNGVYKILGVKLLDEAERIVELDIGDVSLIDTIATAAAGEYTYNYNIAETTAFRIPLATAADNSPVIAAVPDATVTAGKKFTQQISAVSPIDKELSLEAVSLPRGASFDAESGTVTWTPDEKQIGKNVIAIRATDGALSSVVYFSVDVVKSAGSVTSNSPYSDSGAGAGAGSGGGTTGDNTDAGDSTANTPSTGDDTGDDTDAGDGVLDVPDDKFIDLGNHSWAKDAIYSLVDAGVVNGTSENTYSPANNIKRADFAIMLVRAFGITEGEGENFADVAENKYYAEELRLAKANGIVNGIGNDKFNPEGEITRQDMMLMLARALDAVSYELSEADQSVLSRFSDSAQISDYAKDAVSRVVNDGIIAGANGKINPLAKATRAEVAVMLQRVLNAK